MKNQLLKIVMITLLLSNNLFGYELNSAGMPTITAATLDWQLKELPKELEKSKVYKNWQKDYWVENNVRWGYLTKNTILVQDNTWYANGLALLVVNTNGQKVNQLTSSRGGFVYFPNGPETSNKPQLVLYSKDGVQYERVAIQLMNSGAKVISRYDVPTEITRLGDCFLDFYNYFWFLNYGHRDFHSNRSDTPKRQAECQLPPSSIKK